jgi:hypothetical protein
MRYLLTILPFFFLQSLQAQITVNAGADQTIYLTETNQVTLVGTTNLSSSLWREVSTDYMSGARIANAGSLITTVSGLPQGVFYFELSVTAAGVTLRDTMKVTVDYAPAPGTFLTSIPISNPSFQAIVNLRDDTTSYFGYDDTHSYFPMQIQGSNVRLYLERSHTPGMYVDAQKGKLYNTLQDGYAWNGSTYDRSQLTFGTNAAAMLDTNKIYCFELKFYFPQPVAENMATIGSPDWGRFAVFGIHGDDAVSGDVSIQVARDSVCFYDGYYAVPDPRRFIKLISTADCYNKTHTFRLTIKEGANYSGQDAFVKVEIDGVQKYYRNFGQVGNTLQRDYPKLTGLYDYNNLIVNPLNLTRNKKFSLVTEAFNWYVLSDATAPTISVCADQTITVLNTTVSAKATGQNVAYHWSEKSGGSATIVSPDSAVTDITNLATGIYIFECTATSNGQTASADVTVTVSTVLSVPTHVKHIPKKRQFSIAVTSDLKVKITSDRPQNMNVYLYDVQGRKLEEKSIFLLDGDNYVQFKKPVRGVYILMFQNYFINEHQEILVQ